MQANQLNTENDLETEALDAEKDREENRAKTDFKMITFSLAGKDYGIDIMKVKEISKVSKFTYIPNTYPYVRGVHNLRGDIIPVIDLRKMFHLQYYTSGKDNQKEGVENVLILRLKESVIGVIVDTIEKVIAIASQTIQPPPALFSGINIEYLSGVVEHADKLYIILNVDSIFAEDTKETVAAKAHIELKDDLKKEKRKDSGSITFDFIAEGLASLKKFHVTTVNEDWVKMRLNDWISMCEKQKRDSQLCNTDDAESFLYNFYSPCTGLLWDEKYLNSTGMFLPDVDKGAIDIWNPGCGKGLESYSFACCVKMKYKAARVKLWANENSLIDISTAPNIVLMEQDIPDVYKQKGFAAKSEKGYRFSKEITDAIFFEYHDISGDNSIPEADFIIARDVLSFFPAAGQDMLLLDFKRILKPGGVLFIGRNEKIKNKEWKSIGDTIISAYVKETE